MVRVATILIRSSPIIYIILIWLQSSYFNTSKAAEKLEMPLLSKVMIGTIFELLHVFEFGILLILFLLAWYTYRPLSCKVLYKMLIITALYAIIDEVHQHFVPFRSASIFDLFKNWLGIIAVYVGIKKWGHTIKRFKLLNTIKSYRNSL